MLIFVHLVIAAHITHWLVAGRTITPVEPSEAMAFSRAGIVNAGLLFFAATILLTAIFGRFFCGWACHVVALQDLCRWLLEKVGIRPVALRSRALGLVPLLAFAYMFLWPLAYRVWIGDSLRTFEMELTTTEFWATFPGWVIGGLTFLLCGFVAVYFLGAKGFCTNACPYGAAFGLAEKLSPMRIRVTDACAGCGHCTAVCTSNVSVHAEVRDYGMVVDSGCMKCLDCVSVCPNDALYYGAGPLPLWAKPRVGSPAKRRWPLSWGEEALLAVAFALAFFTFRGLYGVVPFLMSLGLGAILAYLVQQTYRLGTRPDRTLRRRALKRAGALTPAGRAFVVAMALLALFWAHSGWIRYHTFRGESGFSATLDLRREVFDVTRPLPTIRSDRSRTIARAAEHLAIVEHQGLFPTRGNASRRAWLAFLTNGEDLGELADLAIARGEDAFAMHQLVARRAADLGDLERAVPAYQAAINAAPSVPDGWIQLGILLARAGRLPAAEQVFAQSVGHVQDSPELFYNEGLVKAFLGKTDEAIERFQRSLELDPWYREARENLAGTLASAGRFDDAAIQFRMALEQAPDDTETRQLLAQALLAAGRVPEAREELEQILRLSPDHPEAGQLLDHLRRTP